ncbi:uncharacterized protein BDZ99DRAFT_456692 [Mytilinidion resinicola]|uniref:Uncharacterized protein n=1 Tax=Mytilinidion resinicola TaxID=574789 RepID=A0A6A6Z9C3_9PEZI|nr:uncharacterized protein BDZ99DRAFT_456692 [Mytilinidion resinicola]KAF2816884.1 hypothetical protein BDZ99DRAFT_456692 [Mytilinidion resinicola]
MTTGPVERLIATAALNFGNYTPTLQQSDQSEITLESATHAAVRCQQPAIQVTPVNPAQAQSEPKALRPEPSLPIRPESHPPSARASSQSLDPTRSTSIGIMPAIPEEEDPHRAYFEDILSHKDQQEFRRTGFQISRTPKELNEAIETLRAQSIDQRLPINYQHVIRMDVDQFDELVEQLSSGETPLLKKSGKLTAKYKLLLFMYIIAHDAPFISTGFLHSCLQNTIERSFSEVVDSLILFESRLDVSAVPHFNLHKVQWRTLEWDCHDKKKRKLVVSQDLRREMPCTEQDLKRAILVLNNPIKNY